MASAAVAASSAEKAPIRTAVYGLGHAHASSKLRTARTLPEFDLAGFCEPRSEQSLADVDLAGVARFTEGEMLSDPSIELIVVEARVQEGLGYAREAVAAGKHVHLDKPAGTDLESFRRLLDEAGREKLVVQMGYQWRYHHAMNAAIDLARRGGLGSVYMVRGVINKPISEADRRELAAFKGGMMFEMGCHLIDRTIDLLGPPLRAEGRLRHDALIEDGLADNTLAVLEFEHAMAEIYMAAMQPHGNDYRTFEILGTKGTATVQPFSPDGSLTVDLAEETGSLPAGRSRVPLSIPAWPGAPYAMDFLDLYGAIREKRPLRWSAEHDLAVQRTLLEVCEMV